LVPEQRKYCFQYTLHSPAARDFIAGNGKMQTKSQFNALSRLKESFCWSLSILPSADIYPTMDLAKENRKLRQKLEALTSEARNNETVLQRFHDRELALLTAESLPELLSSLTDGMFHSFGLHSLSLVLQDPEHEIRHLLRNTDTPAEAFPLLYFADDLEILSPAYLKLQRPRLGPFVGDEHAQLFPGAQQLQSVALLPMRRGNCLIGSLNLGSQDPQRFTRHHGSDFLYRLGTIGAVCLENATNRERLVISGMTDPLTGLHNRRYLERRLKEELARAARYRIPLSCLFFDADHFKRVNDNFGHATGDLVLQEIARRIKSCLRFSDIAVRYGGEEFAVILPQTCAKEAAHLAERIRLEVESTPVATDDAGNPLDITVSIGVSETLPRASEQHLRTIGEQLLMQADNALYEAKNRGRNQVMLYKNKQDQDKTADGDSCFSNEKQSLAS
jgi:diguanylate cyclase (GGDEF)-like protein